MRTMNKIFNPEMLVLARAARGLTQTELLRLAPLLSQSKLSKIEAGLIKPSNEEVSSFASALKFQSSFFYKPHLGDRRPLPIIGKGSV